MYIRVFKNGTFRADVRLKGITKVKTFQTKKLAESWAISLEKNIKLIPTLSHDAIIALSPDKIDFMGGTELFSSLGFDVFTIQNKERLKQINELSKKELLQLTAHQIESMGGAELFALAGKRIRYKTLRSVCGEYLEHWSGKDYDNQMYRVNYWCSLFGNKIITDIDIFDIRDQVDLMIEEGQRPTTIIRKKAVLSSIFKYALSRGYIDKNVVVDVKISNDAKQRNRVLTDNERAALLDSCRQSHWDKLYLLVLMALVSGARRSELLGLHWNDIDFKSNVALLSDTKNGTSRTLLFPSIAMAELKRFQQTGNGLLFESEKNPALPKDIRKAWAKALKIAGISDKDILNADNSVKIEKYTFHCLRHGFCTALSDAGKELSQIAEMAGHKSIQTTMRYVHQGNDQKQKIVDELAASYGL